MESAEDMSSAEISDMVEALLELVPDFSAQLEFHPETPKEQRTHVQLLGRLRQIIDRDEERQQRMQQEEVFSKQLRNTPANRGLIG